MVHPRSLRHLNILDDRHGAFLDIVRKNNLGLRPLDYDVKPSSDEFDACGVSKAKVFDPIQSLRLGRLPAHIYKVLPIDLVQSISFNDRELLRKNSGVEG